MNSYNRVKKSKMANIRVLNKNNASDKKILDKISKNSATNKKGCSGCSRKKIYER